MTGAPPVRRGGAVLGSPIGHSLSPVLHAAAYAALGLDGWAYRAVECTEAELAAVLEALDAEGLAGVSLTMPLKRAVLPMLPRADRLVADLGVCNTVLFGGAPIAGEPQWYGANTDVAGLAAALAEAGVRRAGAATVLGGGATAASAVAALASLGAAEVLLLVRDPASAAGLAAVAARLGVAASVEPLTDARIAGDVVVATLPAGALDAPPAAGVVDQLLPAGSLPPLVDVVYSPWPTPLARRWAERGGTVVGGLSMLVAQAAEQVRLMTGQEPPLAAMRAAVGTV